MKMIVMTDETYEWFEKSIAEMRELYADQDARDYFDADDTARDVADRLGEVLEEQAWEAV